MDIRKRVEQNVTIWLLSTLTAGFLAGWGAYETILKVTQRVVVAKEELDRLKENTDKTSVFSCEKFGVALTQREQKVNDKDEAIFVSGTAESLPPEYQIWIVAAKGPGSSEYYPREPAHKKGKQWDLQIVPGLNTREDKKRFVAIVVGPNGQALIEYYKSTMKNLVPEGANWPSLKLMALDMARCSGFHEVSLK